MDIAQASQTLIHSLFEENSRLKALLNTRNVEFQILQIENDRYKVLGLGSVSEEIEKYKKLLEKYNEWCPELKDEYVTTHKIVISRHINEDDTESILPDIEDEKQQEQQEQPCNKIINILEEKIPSIILKKRTLILRKKK